MIKQWKDANHDPAYVLAVQDECVRSFKSFVKFSFKYVFRKKFIWSGLHDELATELMRVWTGKNKNLICNMPPRYGKTELLCLFCAWAYGHNPICEFMHLSYSDKLTVRNSKRIKAVLASQFYQDIFGVKVNPKKDAAEEWETEEGGVFCARSTGGQVTGFGAGQTDETDEDGEYVFSGMLWIDDPLKPKDAHTIRREQINDAWEETIKSRRNASTTPTVCIMQRIHEGDFTAMLIADTFENFKVLKLRALREDGTALWPFKHTVEVLLAMKEKALHVFSSQYQQDPSPAGGSIFKADWWMYFLEIPEFERVIITADTAQKAKEVHDYSVFQLWGLYNHKIYLLDQERGKWEAPDLKVVAINFIRKCKKLQPKLNAVYIEDKASGTGLIQSLPNYTSIPINAVQRNTDKITRSFDAAPYVQSGQVLLRKGASYVGIFVAEHSSFNAENTHLHDDQIDPMMDAVDKLLDKKTNTMFDNI